MTMSARTRAAMKHFKGSVFDVLQNFKAIPSLLMLMQIKIKRKTNRKRFSYKVSFSHFIAICPTNLIALLECEWKHSKKTTKTKVHFVLPIFTIYNCSQFTLKLD